MHRLATIHNVTDRQMTTTDDDRRNSVPIARPLVRSAKNLQQSLIHWTAQKLQDSAICRLTSFCDLPCRLSFPHSAFYFPHSRQSWANQALYWSSTLTSILSSTRK